MPSYDRQILILGNSHISSFDRQFKTAVKGSLDPSCIHTVLTNFLASPWRELDQNSNLHVLKFRKEFGPPTDLSAHRGKVDLVIIGAGVLGSGLLSSFSLIESVPRNEEANAASYTPRLPRLLWVKLKAVPSHTLPPIHPWVAQLMYRFLWRRRISVLDALLKSGQFRSIHWVAEPDMTENVARVRFGDGLVDSGLYEHHRKLATKAFEKLTKAKGFRTNFVTHPDSHRSSSGFTKSEFAASISKTDVHTNTEYYKESVEFLLHQLFE